MIVFIYTNTQRKFGSTGICIKIFKNLVISILWGKAVFLSVQLYFPFYKIKKDVI